MVLTGRQEADESDLLDGWVFGTRWQCVCCMWSSLPFESWYCSELKFFIFYKVTGERASGFHPMLRDFYIAGLDKGENTRSWCLHCWVSIQRYHGYYLTSFI